MKAQSHRKFVAYLSTIIDLDVPARELIYTHTKAVAFPKGHIISAAGQVCKCAYFIVSGEARSYYTDFSGKTTTWIFHFNEPVSNVKNLIVVDYKSFLNGKPASLTCETLTNVMAIQISKTDLSDALANSRVYERAMRKVSDQSFIVAYDRAFTLLTMSASERYDKLLMEEPHFAENVLQSLYRILSWDYSAVAQPDKASANFLMLSCHLVIYYQMLMLLLPQLLSFVPLLLSSLPADFERPIKKLNYVSIPGFFWQTESAP